MPVQTTRATDQDAPDPDEVEVDVVHRQGDPLCDGELRVDVIGPTSRWVCSTYQARAERYDRGGLVPEAVDREDIPEWVKQALAGVRADRVVL